MDFSKTNWFEANLCSILGAVRPIMVSNEVQVEYTNLQSKVDNIFTRNGFLGNEYGVSSKGDTVVKFQHFHRDQDDSFTEYIKRELMCKRDFPKLSNLLSDKIVRSIFEVFDNARTHGGCEHVYACGQYYPQKYPPRLDMTIVDMGSTIHRNVESFLNRKMTACEAIEWAVQNGNTTKIDRTGGLGLHIILDFIRLNNGVVQIISSDGFWEHRKGKTLSKQISKKFMGTIVNIEFNFSDKESYILESEAQDLDIDDLF